MRVGVFGNVVLIIDESKFKLGRVVLTKGVHAGQAEDKTFAQEVPSCLPTV